MPKPASQHFAQLQRSARNAYDPYVAQHLSLRTDVTGLLHDDAEHLQVVLKKLQKMWTAYQAADVGVCKEVKHAKSDTMLSTAFAHDVFVCLASTNFESIPHEVRFARFFLG